MAAIGNKWLSSEAERLISLVFIDDWHRLEVAPFAIDALVSLAIKHGLGPLVFTLASQNNSDAANILRDKLRGVYMASAMTNTRLTATCNAITNKLKEAGIESMPLKGCYLSQCIYDDSALRPMSDIDLLVRPEHAAQAYILLTGQEWHVAQQRTTDHHLPPFHVKGHLVELHRYLFPPDVKNTIPIDDIWRHAHPLTHPYNGFKMEPSQLLVYVSLHTYYTMMRGGLRLGWFYDLKLLLQRENGLSANTIRQWVTTWNVQKPFTNIMSILGVLYPQAKETLVSEWVKELTPYQQKRLATMIEHSDQQNVSKSYRLAWERLASTKGWRNKLKWIFGNGKPLWTLPFRLIKYAYRTLLMVFYNLRNKSGW
jgi:hypothetical protein